MLLLLLVLLLEKESRCTCCGWLLKETSSANEGPPEGREQICGAKCSHKDIEKLDSSICSLVHKTSRELNQDLNHQLPGHPPAQSPLSSVGFPRPSMKRCCSAASQATSLGIEGAIGCEAVWSACCEGVGHRLGEEVGRMTLPKEVCTKKTIPQCKGQ
jgi:hypothetical protein